MLAIMRIKNIDVQRKVENNNVFNDPMLIEAIVNKTKGSNP